MHMAKRIWGYTVCMVGIAVAAFAGGMATVFWIESTDSMKTYRTERELAGMFAGMPQAMDMEDLRDFGRPLVEKIKSLPDEEKRFEWCRKVTEAIFKVDTGHLGCWRRVYRITDIDGFVNFVMSACPERSESVEQAWKTILVSLDWQQGQIDRLKEEYAAIKQKTAAKPIPRSVADKARELERAVRWATENSGHNLQRYEIRFRMEKGKMTPETRAEAQRKLETALGRPVRNSWR